MFETSMLGEWGPRRNTGPIVSSRTVNVTLTNEERDGQTTTKTLSVSYAQSISFVRSFSPSFLISWFLSFSVRKTRFMTLFHLLFTLPGIQMKLPLLKVGKIP